MRLDLTKGSDVYGWSSISLQLHLPATTSSTQSQRQFQLASLQRLQRQA